MAWAEELGKRILLLAHRNFFKFRQPINRLTYAFSKKLENHIFALALYFMHYNFARPHKTLSNPYPRTPSMAAGVSDHIWIIEELVKPTE